MNCPHCEKRVFRKSTGGSKLKTKPRILVLHKSGDVEIGCPNCGKGVLLPLRVADGEPELRKAEQPRLVARKA